jgi:hypothetical protein
MVPKPPHGAAQARPKARRKSQRGGRKRIDPRTLAAADFPTLLTSLDAQHYPPQRISGLYRLGQAVPLALFRL